MNWFEEHNKFSWAITFLIAVAIFYFSSIAIYPTSKSLGIKAEIYHICAFFGLTLALLVSSIKRKKLGLIPLIILTSFFYAILDEIHQIYTPGRFFSLEDLAWDASGILIASLVYTILIIKTSHILKTPSTSSLNGK